MAKDTIGHKNQNSMPILAHGHEQQTIYKHSSKRAVAIQRQSYLKISTLSNQPDLKHACSSTTESDYKPHAATIKRYCITYIEEVTSAFALPSN